MKQQILRLWILVAVAVCILMYISLTACSNGDNDEPTDDGGNYPKATNVFKGKKLIAIQRESARLTINYNSKNQMISLHETWEHGKEEYQFDYSKNGVVTMQSFYTEGDVLEEDETIIFSIGSNQFVTNLAYKYDNDGDKIDFKYNSAGQLTYFGNDRHKDNITYEDGDIIRMTNASGDVTTFNYISAEQPIKKENKGMMLYDTMFNVDLDDMQPMFFGGLLGQPTKHLPISKTVIYNEEEETSTDTFSWVFDGSGYPTKLTIKNSSDPYEDVYTFEWR